MAHFDQSDAEKSALYAWDTYDGHPHQRGWGWYTGAAVIIVMVLCGLYWSGNHSWTDGLSMGAILLGLVVYAWIHQKDLRTPRILLHPKGLIVDGKRTEWKEFQHYFLVIDETVALIYFRGKKAKNHHRFLIHPEDQALLEKALKKVGLPLDPDGKEPLLDLWLRALKL